VKIDAEEALVRMDRRERLPNYDKTPHIEGGSPSECAVGWDEIVRRLASSGARVIVVEAYPGVYDEDLEELVKRLKPEVALASTEALRPPDEIDRMVEADVTNDPVFGRITDLSLEDFFDPSKVSALRESSEDARGRVVVYGSGAALVTRGDLLVYADLPRWEIQQRQRRREVGNLGLAVPQEQASLAYKRAFFVDWRVADRHKVDLMGDIDLVLDTTDGERPKMVAADAVNRALDRAVTRPFRVVPFFDPAPWGGQWMKTVCDLDRDCRNYGWCFDCVPEENSLLLRFGEELVELPSMNLVFRNPASLLGRHVYDIFGAEFPIRFDFLDTMDGSNLSLQVHPVTEYIRDQFGMAYTQDESYYLLDADRDATVYLGLKPGVDPERMIEDLRKAEDGDFHFPDEEYVNRFPAKRHDHFLIPSGTVHCSGANSLVLEISATPYIFTFKLWDWDRLGLDGKPRPVHIDHGAKSIRWSRDAEYVKRELINRFHPMDSGEGWRRERTGLHSSEFIETHRHWFTGVAPHQAGFGVNVINLVQGEEAVVESADGGFDPFVVHYAETFIVPAEAGAFTMRPHGIAQGEECATLKAFVRDGWEGSRG
jgi:mannose-6-phosphate isomerase class I